MEEELCGGDPLEEEFPVLGGVDPYKKYIEEYMQQPYMFDNLSELIYPLGKSVKPNLKKKKLNTCEYVQRLPGHSSFLYDIRGILHSFKPHVSCLLLPPCVGKPWIHMALHS